MVKLLLDTCVLSEWNRPSGREVVTAALAPFPNQALYLSVVTLGEIEAGLSRLEFGAKRAGLETWARILESRFAHSLLPVDVATARMWGRIVGERARKGKAISLADGLLAATAIVHGLVMVTRNKRDFTELDIPILDPWEKG